MKGLVLTAAFAGLALTTIMGASRAEVPNTITYQGRLIKSGASPAGEHTIRACIKTVGAASCLWQHDYVKTLPPSGDFTLKMDIDTPIDWLGAPLQIELAIDGNIVSPVDNFSGVPYAIVAGTAAHAVSAASAASAQALAGALPASQVRISGATTLDDWRSASNPAMIDAGMIDGSLAGQWTPGGGGALYHAGGSVGVGTSLPGAKLSIVDPLIPSLQIRRDASNEWFLSVTDTGRLGFRANGASEAEEKFTLLANGNVGIGTTAPGEKMEIAAGSSSDSLLINGPSSNTGDIRFKDASRTPSDFGIDYASGSLRFFTETAPGVGGVERLVVANSGNVGIGTPATSHALTVSGTVEARVLRFGENAANLGNIHYVNGTNVSCPAGTKRFMVRWSSEACTPGPEFGWCTPSPAGWNFASVTPVCSLVFGSPPDTETASCFATKWEEALCVGN